MDLSDLDGPDANKLEAYRLVSTQVYNAKNSAYCVPAGMRPCTLHVDVHAVSRVADNDAYAILQYAQTAHTQTQKIS